MPHLEYAAEVWNPYTARNIKILENVQRQATKLVPRIRNWYYEKRLAVLGLTTLIERRVRGDMLQLFNVNKNTNLVNWAQYPVNCSS